MSIPADFRAYQCKRLHSTPKQEMLDLGMDPCAIDVFEASLIALQQTLPLRRQMWLDQYEYYTGHIETPQYVYRRVVLVSYQRNLYFSLAKRDTHLDELSSNNTQLTKENYAAAIVDEMKRFCRRRRITPKQSHYGLQWLQMMAREWLNRGDVQSVHIANNGHDSLALRVRVAERVHLWRYYPDFDLGL